MNDNPDTLVAAVGKEDRSETLNDLEEDDVLSDDGFVLWDERTGMAQRIRVSRVV
jgi:hypothetical protein